MTFSYLPVRFGLTAIDAVRFPGGRGGNILRGALGLALRDLFCDPGCNDARVCPRLSCVYARIFQPDRAAIQPQLGASGFRDLPRPFALRAHLLDGRVFQPGERFEIPLNLFATREALAPVFSAAFSRLGSQGFGPGRSRAELRDTTFPPEPVNISLEPSALPAARVRIRFVTSTELKWNEGLARRPEFPALFARIRDRIRMLSLLYGSGALPASGGPSMEQAKAIRLERCDLRTMTTMRRSSRTGQVHALSGFTGTAEYAGDLAPFMPWLRAAEQAGLGRHTVWGNGVIEVI